MSEGSPRERRPGILVVWTGSSPTLRAFPLEGELVLGRELLGDTSDDRISRQHARISIRDSTGTDPGVLRFGIMDLGSRNGTYASGQPLVDRAITVTAPVVVRTGRTVAMVLEDIRRFVDGTVAEHGDALVGPSSAPAWSETAAASAAGAHLLVLGEEGVGKSQHARRYSEARGVRDATFNPTVHAVPIERVLGDAATLILEEPGRLLPSHHEVLARLLAQRPELRVVTTASARLEQLGVPAPLASALSDRTVEVPPLRVRPEELSYAVARAARTAAPALTIHSTLIEMALLRPWPGNFRELTTAITQAAHAVAAQGKSNLRGEDLDTEAGYLMSGAPTVNASVQPTLMGARRRRRSVSKADDR
ncbi:MAG: FHA domain-containing protein [Kofleriaceae bacterium]